MNSISEHALEELREVIETFPIIDNHAHNLLRADKQDSYSLLSCVTEATGDALQDTPRSLAHLRAVKQLRELYGCDSSATWNDLLRKRAELLSADPDDLNRRCLAGTHTILIDDGIDREHTVHSYRWHDQFTTGKNKRIVRIETLAADIMKMMYEEGDMPLSGLEHIDSSEIWPVFLQAFENAIADEVKDEDVAGFKSVVCYRTGLDVMVADEISTTAAGQESFRKYLRSCSRGHYRIHHKGLNDCLVISACKLVAASHKQTGISKPFQFHTGLGDNDISLLRSNPAHMQPLIAAFPTVVFVLLHSSYPYTREAGYLATVYKNAYLDLGEIFPMVSIEGQISAIKQSMELTPFSKLLWSTDGHHHPETYWLANKQFRRVLFRVFKDLLAEEVIDLDDAIQAIKDILFENSNRIYNLKIVLGEEQDEGKKPLAIMPSASTAETRTAQIASKETRPLYNHRILQSFLKNPYGQSTTYFIVEWVDHMGTIRSRSMPVSSFRRLVHTRQRLGITRGNLHTLQDDTITPPTNAIGQIYVEPELSTIRPIHWKDLYGSAAVIATFHDLGGAPLAECPRSILTSLSSRLASHHNLSILVGFELEVTFLRLPTSDASSETIPFAPIESFAAHAWGTLTPFQAQSTWPLITKIVNELSSLGYRIDHFHSESGQGQYEFALAPLPLVQAVDNLYLIRQAIQLKAHRYGLRATFHPMPIDGVGSGLHAHISLNPIFPIPPTKPREGSEIQNAPPPTAAAAETEITLSDPAAPAAAITAAPTPSYPESPFWASVLSSLRAICAFTLPAQESYKRVIDDAWTGGSWVAWGTENREVPLRRVMGSSSGDERFEIRCMDGMGNAYFALAAIVGAGLEGLDLWERGEKRGLGRDCDVNPSKMTDAQGEEYGITEKLPQSVEEALVALEGSETLRKAIGHGVVRDYILMKRAEQEKLNQMEEGKRREWLIQRY
ncbi:fluG-like protein [Elsinoe australis]|uniref:FluG-like protein n=1 Tax=Elsinoe australis TaxID=40998 RepID=A0A4U7B158_9PEZI|nr:fluG-like protein [Elsinoe australis]